MKTAEQLIAEYQMLRHPEGPHYVQVYKSPDLLNVSALSRYTGNMLAASTSIYFLIQQNEFSAFHKMASDEIWHFYHGSPVLIHTISAEGEYTVLKLGNPIIHDGYSAQCLVKHGLYFAAEILNKTEFSFVGCTVSPGFEYEDFELTSRLALIKKFPHLKTVIQKFTVVDDAHINS